MDVTKLIDRLDAEFTLFLIGVGVLSLIPEANLGVLILGWGIGRALGVYAARYCNKLKKDR